MKRGLRMQTVVLAALCGVVMGISEAREGVATATPQPEVINYTGSAVTKGITRQADESPAGFYLVKYQDASGGTPVEREFIYLVGLDDSNPATANAEVKPLQFSQIPLQSAQAEQMPIPQAIASRSAGTTGDPPSAGMSTGWGYITYRWPSIWIQNIRAGSVATTALFRWKDANTLYLYLIRNGMDAYNGGQPDPTPVPDFDCEAQMHVSLTDSMWVENLKFEAGAQYHAVRRMFVRDSASGQMRLKFDANNKPENKLFKFVPGSTAGQITAQSYPNPTVPPGEEATWLGEKMTFAKQYGVYEIPPQQ